jgi:hypothetical protein
MLLQNIMFYDVMSCPTLLSPSMASDQGSTGKDEKAGSSIIPSLRLVYAAAFVVARRPIAVWTRQIA